MMEVYKLLINWKQYIRNMVQMVIPPLSRALGKVVSINFGRNNSDLAGTMMPLVSHKDGREHPGIICY